MSLKTKGFFYNFVGFALIYILLYAIATFFTGLTGLWRPITAAVAASLLSPKYQVVKTANGEKLFVSWIFFKGVREVR